MNIDRVVFDFFVSVRVVGFNGPVAWLSELSRPAYLFVVLAALAGAALLFPRTGVGRPAPAWVVPLGVGLANVFVHAVKPLIGRERPAVDCQLVDTAGAAFPSGHAAGAVAAAVLVSWWISRRWVSVALAMWAVAVCLTRLYLGVHWFTDVAAGAAVGLVIAGSTVAVARGSSAEGPRQG